MARTIAIIDYGSGNLRSAAKAFERAVREADLDMQVNVTSRIEDVRTADRIVLPGVGAFADCRAGLYAIEGMVDTLNERVRQQAVPFFGICVGMQLMADAGLEKGTHAGLGWIPGRVTALVPGQDANGRRCVKIPHMGWNNLHVIATHPVLDGLQDDDGQAAHAYFVHSYHLQAEDGRHVLATTDHGGPVTAIVGRQNMLGTQFHPEKSQKTGLRMIANFLRWKP